MSQALRKLAGSLSKSNTTCIFINQLREKIGVMFGNPETTTGGRALKFFSSVRIDIRRIDSIKKDGEIVGNRVRAKVVKNKVAPPFRQAEFDLMYGEGISREGCIVDMAVEAGVAKKSGAWYTYGEERLGQGREAAKQTLKENPDLREELENKVREAFDIPIITRSAEEAEALTPAAKPKGRSSMTASAEELARLRERMDAILRSDSASARGPRHVEGRRAGRAEGAEGPRGSSGAAAEPFSDGACEAGGADEAERAFRKIERLACSREQASEALRRRLARDGFSAEAAEAAVGRAVSCGLVDDRRYADVLVRSRLAQGRGVQGIRAELASLGIEPPCEDGLRRGAFRRPRFGSRARPRRARAQAPARQERARGRLPKAHAEGVRRRGLDRRGADMARRTRPLRAAARRFRRPDRPDISEYFLSALSQTALKLYHRRKLE